MPYEDFEGFSDLVGYWNHQLVILSYSVTHESNGTLVQNDSGTVGSKAKYIYTNHNDHAEANETKHHVSVYI